MMCLPKNPRASRLIEEAIVNFQLDLKGMIVLTEAANGYYALTPMIAAVAGAKKVFAITRDSRFGKANDAIETCLDLARCWGLNDQIEILLSRYDARICEADIVTNLGFVRPLDKTFLRQLKSKAAIPLMWETWEFRSEDLDLAECRRLRIPVLGTNEEHPALGTQRYIGILALKLLLELQIEVFRSYIVVIGGGGFGRYTVEALKNAGAMTVQLTPAYDESLCSTFALEAFERCDAIVVVEHHSRDLLIGQGGRISAKELRRINPALSIAHIAGGVDYDDITQMNIPHRPERFASPGYMSLSTDYVGPRPLIDLHTAGLRVGELLARSRRSGLSGYEAEVAVLQQSSLAQGFENYHSF